MKTLFLLKKSIKIWSKLTIYHSHCKVVLTIYRHYRGKYRGLTHKHQNTYVNIPIIWYSNGSFETFELEQFFPRSKILIEFFSKSLNFLFFFFEFKSFETRTHFLNFEIFSITLMRTLLYQYQLWVIKALWTSGWRYLCDHTWKRDLGPKKLRIEVFIPKHKKVCYKHFEPPTTTNRTPKNVEPKRIHGGLQFTVRKNVVSRQCYMKF